MNVVATHIIDMMLSYEKTEQMEEKEESVANEEIDGIGQVVNASIYVFIVEKKNGEETPVNEAPTHKKNSWFKLRSQRLVSKKELTRKKLKEHLLRKVTPPFNSPQNT